jgi:hypothetical protein
MSNLCGRTNDMMRLYSIKLFICSTEKFFLSKKFETFFIPHEGIIQVHATDAVT